MKVEFSLSSIRKIVYFGLGVALYFFSACSQPKLKESTVDPVDNGIKLEYSPDFFQTDSLFFSTYKAIDFLPKFILLIHHNNCRTCFARVNEVIQTKDTENTIVILSSEYVSFDYDFIQLNKSFSQMGFVTIFDTENHISKILGEFLPYPILFELDENALITSFTLIN